MTRNERETFEKAIAEFGETKQLVVMFEELSELQKAVCKSIRYARTKAAISHITEEMADVYIMLDQLKMIFGISEENIEMWRMDKVVRLRERLGLAEPFQGKAEGVSNGRRI